MSTINPTKATYNMYVLTDTNVKVRSLEVEMGSDLTQNAQNLIKAARAQLRPEDGSPADDNIILASDNSGSGISESHELENVTLRELMTLKFNPGLRFAENAPKTFNHEPTDNESVGEYLEYEEYGEDTGFIDDDYAHEYEYDGKVMEQKEADGSSIKIVVHDNNDDDKMDTQSVFEHRSDDGGSIKIIVHDEEYDQDEFFDMET